MALASVGLKTAIWNNNLRSLFLLVLYPFILMGVVWALAALYGLNMAYGYGYGGPALWQSAARHGNVILAAWWPSILGVVMIWFTISLFFHTRMMRLLSHAAPVTRDEEPELYGILETLCISRGLDVPRLEIIETQARNAFASGIGKKSYSITVTRGLLQTLDKDELEAVLGHELTHIMNNDVRLLVISVIFVGMLGFAAQMMWSQLRYGLRYSGRRRSRENGGSMLLFFLGVNLVLWVGYLATLFTRFALTRRRELMADAGAIELTKNPAALMRALIHISQADRIPEATGDVALMCIENSRPFLGLFATHPSLATRLRQISETTNTPIPGLDSSGHLQEQASPDFKNPWA